MSEALKIALAALAGISVFVLGQIAVTLWLEPISQQRRLIGEIAVALTVYGNTFGGSSGVGKERVEKASDAFRELAGRLRGSSRALWAYPVWERVGWARSRGDIREASRSLIGLSNGGLSDGGAMDNAKRSEEVRRHLAIEEFQ